MPKLSSSAGLTITNPLVLYRSLIATKRIKADPAQHRLALHLQKIYNRLLDYEPEIEYSHRIKQLTKTVSNGARGQQETSQGTQRTTEDGERKGFFASLRAQKEQKNVLALTRRLTDYESATQIQSPQGLLLYGDVGTGKSMLVDMLAESLPSRKKRRWHFNTFMLETFARLEQLRKSRVSKATILVDDDAQEHSLLRLAREMISTSPVVFLDEFQLPDRAASKILSNLLVSFFHLGGVLIATSNRMPEELANASGVEFAAPPASRTGMLRSRWGMLGAGQRGRSENMFSQQGDFAAFLEVLRTRCEVFQMEGSKDWRREDASVEEGTVALNYRGFEGLEPVVAGNVGLGYEQSLHTKPPEQGALNESKKPGSLPKHYHMSTAVSSTADDREWELTVLRSLQPPLEVSAFSTPIPWETTSLRVYGRILIVPRHRSGVNQWTFKELCTTNLGPADYITLASTFHTLILTDVPILTFFQKNEARRLITLLDALYEARCKLLIRAAAGPDELFFPETKRSTSGSISVTPMHDRDGVYPETFAEIYQDTISPFRPNISSYTPSASFPSYPSHPTTRSILADEDSDFGPVYGAGRTRGASDGSPGAGNEIGRQAPDFAQISAFTGEDEKFAYKRARSRLWEMCSEKWWARQEEGWWRPLSKETRRWESGAEEEQQRQSFVKKDQRSHEMTVAEEDEGLFRHGASPFRTAAEPPPKIGWTHAWGMMRWGKKAGAWGKGVEGLSERKKGDP